MFYVRYMRKTRAELFQDRSGFFSILVLNGCPGGRCRPFPNDNDVLPVMRLFPGIVVVIMNFKIRLRPQNGQHLPNDIVPARVGVATSQLHRSVIHISKHAAQLQQGRRLVHLLARSIREKLSTGCQVQKPLAVLCPNPLLPK